MAIATSPGRVPPATSQAAGLHFETPYGRYNLYIFK